MLRKIFSLFILAVFLSTQILPTRIDAVPTDGMASNWTYEKAEHLARKSLFYPTPSEVNELYQAGNVSDAVDILNPDDVAPDRSLYESQLSEFIGSGYTTYFGTGNFGWNVNQGNMWRYYLYRYYRDPYQAKAKLSTLFEDMYSVNTQFNVIEYTDILNLHNLLYKHTFGNYKTLVKRVLLNNPTDKGDFATSEFLNLLRQWNYTNPNENYPREMLQLFLMGEYKPGESKDTNDIRNYSEEDVAALSRIITGFWSDPVPDQQDSSVYHRKQYHNSSSGITFLSGNTGGVNFPFYNGTTDTLDLSGMTVPILGNNGLGDNTVDYIFAKRSYEISLFLAEKLFRFYVHETPTRNDLEGLAQEIRSNNFEILPSIKWLLTQDVMYSDMSMNSVIYASPLDLVIGLFRTLHHIDPLTLDTNFYAYSDLLSRLGWVPFIPGSIFGRDGFDSSYKWFSGYTTTQWSNLATTISYDLTRTGSYRIDNIIPITSSGGSDISQDYFIDQVEDNLLLGRELPDSVKNTIKKFLTTSETGAIIPFQPNNLAYRELKFPGVFALVFSQPEFLLKSGYDQLPSSVPVEPSKVGNASGTLIVVELPGGYDWLNGIIQKDDYDSYEQLRTDGSGNTIVQPLSNLIDIGDFYMNKYLAYSGGVEGAGSGLKVLLDSGNLKIFNRVGTSKHSRDHDQAQRQIVSLKNSTVGGNGILGQITAFEQESTHAFVMGSKRPNILQGGNYTNLGVGDNRIIHTNPKGKLNTNQRNQFTNMLVSTFTGRTYPGKTGDRYSDAIKIHTISQLSVSQGGLPGVGGSTAAQLKFVKTLLDNNQGEIFYLQNTGNGYDTHSDQLIGTTNLDIGIGKAVSDLSVFFQNIKDQHNVTIVVYSEFGRTNRMNGTQGTDHGEGGGIFVITNQPKLLSTWTGSVYGSIKTSLERNDWLSASIDYRSIYDTIIDAIFESSDSSFFEGYTGSMEKNLSKNPAKLTLLHTQFVAPNDSKVYPLVKFRVEGENFDMEKGSYVRTAYSSGGIWRRNTSAFVDTKSQNYTRVQKGGDGFFSMYTHDLEGYKGINELTPYSYSINPITNQYIENVYTGSVLLPEVRTWGINSVSTGSHSLLLQYYNSNITPSGFTPSESGILLASHPTLPTIFSPGTGAQIIAYSGSTRITRLTSSGTTRIWHGGFIIGETLDSPGFIPEEAYFSEDGLFLKNFSISNIVRIGSDVIGVGMELSQPVQIRMSGAEPNTPYLVITSTDGVRWSRQSPDYIFSNSLGEVIFDTDHFSLFALTEAPILPICDLQVDNTVVRDGSNVRLTWSTLASDVQIISPTIGTVGSSGSIDIIPPTNAVTLYTLQSTNINGSSSCQVSVRSLPIPSCNIQASKSNSKNNSSLTLSWTGNSALTSELFPDIGVVPSIASLSVVPPSNSTTTYELIVSNEVGTGSCSTSVTTSPNNIPIAVNDTFSLVEDTPSFFEVLSNDSDMDVGDILTVHSVMQPQHGTIDAFGTGIYYTPNSGFCGSDTFSYQIRDQDLGVSQPQSVGLTITCISEPPISSSMSVTGVEDTPLSLSLSGSDRDGDILQYSITSSPNHGSILLGQSGSVIYTPSLNYHGSDSFQYSVYDGTQSGNTSTVSILISSVNDTPITLADTSETNRNSVAFIDILSNDSDPDHDIRTMSPTFVTQATHGSLSYTPGLVVYTPDFGYCGSDQFEYRVTDGSGSTSNTSPVTLSVLCINDAPLALNDTITISEDSSGIIDFLQNDSDPDFLTGSDMITFHEFRSEPSHGTLILTQSGTQTLNRSHHQFFYRPNTNFCGVDSFSYRIRDNLGNISNTAFVSITIACINDTPTVTDSIIQGFSDRMYTGSLGAEDIDSSDLTYDIVLSPIYGTVSLSSTGYYSYQSPESFSGTDTFYYRARDSENAFSQTGKVQFNLSRIPDSTLYTGPSLSDTGSVFIMTGTVFASGHIIDLDDKSITVFANSGTTGFIQIPGTLDIVIESGIWSGEILGPQLIQKNEREGISLDESGVRGSLPDDTVSLRYEYSPIDTYKAGSTNAGLMLMGGYATLEIVLTDPSIVFGSVVQILRSQDGQVWEQNFPDRSCIVDNENKCIFRTNHLTYFGIVQQIASPVVQIYSSVSGPGGASYSSAPISSQYSPGLVLSGGVQPSSIHTTPTASGYTIKSKQYVEWLRKYLKKYDEKYLAEKVYWDILRKNDSVESRIEVIDSTVMDIIQSDILLSDIANMVDEFWQRKLKYKIQRGLIPESFLSGK